MAVGDPTFVQPLGGDYTKNAKIVVVDYTFDDDYEDGGAVIDINELGLSEVWFAVVDQLLVTAAEEAFIFRFNTVDNTIVAFVSDDAAADDEVATSTGSSSVEGIVVRIFLYGLGS